MTSQSSPTPDFRTLFEALPGLYLVLTPDLTIAAVSDAYLRTTLTEREALLGREMFDLNGENLRASLERVLQNLVADTMDVQSYSVQHPEGFEERFFRAVNSPVLNDQQEIAYIIHQLEDVTELMRLTQQLDEANASVNQAASKLEEANQDLDSFAYSVSHDLRAPLRALDGFSKILLQDYREGLDPKAQRYLDLVNKNALQMTQLINDMLVFSRLSRQTPQKRTVAPAEIVGLALEELRAEQEGRQIEITLGELPKCAADPALIKQVFVNLLSNALKYSRKREVATIEIGSRSEDGTCVYFVKDNGVGFDMQYAHKLFGVFQRLHSANEYEGTGVGLAIAHRIITRHGGRIWADAADDQGATFYFTLDGEPLT